jgi:integrase
MGVKIKQWKGAWWIFINHQGRRKARRVGIGEAGKKTARLVAQQIQARLVLGQAAFQSQKSGVTIDAYGETFLHRIEHTRKHTTLADYTKILTRDILPALRGLDLQDITREKVKALALAGLQKGQSPKTVQNIVRCLSSLLSHAVEDGHVRSNTALKPGKFLPKVGKRHHIAPLRRKEVSVLIETAKTKLPRYYPLFLCAVRTGLRMGESLALQWDDIDWQGRFIEVQRNYTHWKLTTPKSRGKPARRYVAGTRASAGRPQDRTTD